MKRRSLRLAIHHILDGHEPRGTAGHLADAGLALLIVSNAIAMALETEPAIGAAFGPTFRWFEAVSVAIFTIEYGLRIWTLADGAAAGEDVRSRLRFIVTPMALVDLAAILPFYLPRLIRMDLRFLRVIRLFRLVRLMKLGRYSTALRTLGKVLRAKRTELAAALLVVVILMVPASAIVYFAEHEAQPKVFSSIPASMWWSVVTLTTVGYGDIYPVTVLGKLVGAILAVLGIGLFALPAGILASGFAAEMDRSQHDGRRCPHCGKDLP